MNTLASTFHYLHNVIGLRYQEGSEILSTRSTFYVKIGLYTTECMEEVRHLTCPTQKKEAITIAIVLFTKLFTRFLLSDL